MLIFFVLILIITGIAILFNVYSIINPFANDFINILDYNVAYYGAVSAIERGELVLKYKGPGFEGSGGWLENSNFGKASDLITGNFTIFTGNKMGLARTISSRTNRIPKTGDGNVDFGLSHISSIDYNKIDYKNVENFVFYIDTSTPSQSYSGNLTTRLDYGGLYVSGIFRLPPKIKSGFNDDGLCNSQNLECDPDGDGIYDDVVVDWTLNGFKDGVDFSILPTIAVKYYGNTKEVEYTEDIAIRESIIGSGIKFGDSFNIFDESALYPNKNNYIANAPTIENSNFENIFSDAFVTGMELKFGLVNLLNTLSGNIYPFLEYYFEFDEDVSDRFFNILGHGRKGLYDVKILIKKPTTKESIGGSFTVIF